MGLLHSRSRSQLRFRMLVNVCLDDIFWTTEHFVTKLGVFMQHHEPECHAKKLFLLLLLLSLNCEGSWGTTDDFATSFLHLTLFPTARCDLADSRPVHSLMLSSHLFLCLPCLLPPFTVPCKMVLTRPDEQETWPYHSSLRLFTMDWKSSCGPIACWILAQTSLLVTWSMYEMHSILW